MTHAYEDGRDVAAYEAYVIAEMAHEAKYPHVDFPDGNTFSPRVPGIREDKEFDAADEAHMSLIRASKNGF